MEEGNYRDDGEARALYYKEYRAIYDVVKGFVTIGMVVPPSFDISIIGNNLLLPHSFDLRNQDRGPIENFIFPGKSAQISFTHDIDLACRAIFDRPARRTDHLYIVGGTELGTLEFYPYYVPLPNMPLHVRIVHRAQLDDPTNRDIPFKSRLGLTSLLNRRKVD